MITRIFTNFPAFTPESDGCHSDPSGARNGRHVLVLAALGIGFGDIGTSPLYAFRECFIRTLAQACKRAGWLVHAGNHYHLLVGTPQANLVRGMTWFQTTYTVRYNTRTSGHL